MLKISEQTMAALDEASEATFRQRLVSLLQTRFPEHARDPTALAAMVEIGVADARAMSLRGERGLAAYVVAAFVLGLDIRDDPHVIAALRESGDNEAARIDWLEGYVTAVAEALEG
jgi:hypothetical protein